MNQDRALWEKGDFTRIAESMRESGEAVAKGLGVIKGLKVLETSRPFLQPSSRSQWPFER